MAGETAQNLLASRLANGIPREPDRGKRGRERFRKREIAKAGHGDLPGHGDTEPAALAQDADRQQIIDAADGVDSQARRRNFAKHGFAPGGTGLGLKQQTYRIRAGSLQRQAPAFQPLGGAQVAVIGAAHKGNAFAPAPQHVVYQSAHGFFVRETDHLVERVGNQIEDSGSGSQPHLGTELLKVQTGIDLVHVPYKGGGPMVTDLLGGTIQVVLGDQANLMPQVQGGRLRALAVATARRSPNMPELPTIAESGLAGFDATAWQGLVGPAGMPADVVRRLNDALSKVMAMPAVREKLLGAGLDPMGGSSEQFSRFIADEMAKWSKIAKDVGAKPE